MTDTIMAAMGLVRELPTDWQGIVCAALYEHKPKTEQAQTRVVVEALASAGYVVTKVWGRIPL